MQHIETGDEMNDIRCNTTMKKEETKDVLLRLSVVFLYCTTDVSQLYGIDQEKKGGNRISNSNDRRLD